MPTDILDTVLLFSLPASGKSETRTYMASLTPEQCRREMAMGPTAQLDDYPYVYMMHRIDDELYKRGQPYVFYQGPNRPFIDKWTWATLIELLNEDYADLRAGRQYEVASAAQLLFDRLDRARERSELHAALDNVPYRVRIQIGEEVEKKCRDHLDERNRQAAQGVEGKTIVIEAARGAPNGSAFPVTPPQGYGATFQQLSPTILERAAVLYIWVTPEESRRKNIKRGLPDGQGSILNHSVPMEVMLGEYGTDDMDWLLKTSGREDMIKVERIVRDGARFANRTYWLPAAKFDNRSDKTSFIHEESDPAKWATDKRDAIHQELARALQTLLKGYNSR